MSQNSAMRCWAVTGRCETGAGSCARCRGGADRSLPYTIAPIPSHPPWQHKIKKIQIRKDTNDVKRLQEISKDEDRSLPFTPLPPSHPIPLTTQKRIIKSKENVKRHYDNNKKMRTVLHLPFPSPSSSSSYVTTQIEKDIRKNIENID